MTIIKVTFQINEEKTENKRNNWLFRKSRNSLTEFQLSAKIKN